MEIHRILTKEGTRSFAFEVENAYISPATVAHLLAGVEGVTDIELRKRLSTSSDVHVQFKYLSQPYIVWEPYGDSSMYWIGPKDEVNDVGGIAALEDVFKQYRPPLWRALLGDVLTLRMLTRLIDRGRKV